MKHEHEHGHHHAKEQAEKETGKIEERLEEKTLHAHRKAMPHGDGTDPPHEEHVGHGATGTITTA
ncbi:hypothetical protein GCM10023188_15460 [Pontibacter saemangeumensis]|uniref:Uncharacterized protein n=1 Tax=Pontibacter saemangeumensis TaxID=1084525 RepID=A0ABP8LJR3_9BACT